MLASHDERIPFVLLVLGVVAVSLGLVAGLDVAVGESGSTGELFDGNVSAQLERVDGLTATREVVVRHDNRTSTTVERVAARPGTGAVRATTLSGSDTDLRVSNGSVLWLYDRDAGTATRLTRSPSATRLGDRISRLVTRLETPAESGDGTQTPSVGVSPLPVVPADTSGQTMTEPTGQRNYTVSYGGTESVDGRAAVVVELAQSDAGAGPVTNFTQTLWLDSRWYYPLKQRTAWVLGGQRRAITTTYRNVTFNPDIAPSTFVFDPPPNATVEAPETPTQQRYDSVGALRSEATLSVPRPALPDSFALVRATRTTGRVDSIGLRYANATSTLDIAKITPVIEPTTDGTTVAVAGKQATYRNLGPEGVLTWSCDDVQYKVSGRNVPRAQVVAVARSVACG
jgi:outer membrane lipoprotein-sorting protein